jgi:beta-glucosidase
MTLHKSEEPQIDLRQSEDANDAPAGQAKEGRESLAAERRAHKHEAADNKEILEFPRGFLWGTSTSAYQVEGGIRNNWSVWEQSEERLKQLKRAELDPDDYICGQAVDFYHKYREDLDRAAELGTGAFRFSLEWARLQPERDTWDTEAFNYYRDLMRECRQRGLKTVVTLWHWTEPVWFSREGGWSNKQAVDFFMEYVSTVLNELGGSVDYWVTLNEPMIYLGHTYITGQFPPGKRKLLRYFRAKRNLVEAHKQSYDIIHKHFPKSQVGFTNITNFFEPARKWCPVEIFISKLVSYVTNSSFLNKVRRHMDYVGVDYYFHDRIVWYPPFKKNLNKKTTDMGWEIYPEGIYHVLMDLSKYGKPIYVMENGLADESDRHRADFIREHLAYVYAAIADGADVRGYFYWSLLDNFEWDKGWYPKFGLYEVNLETMARKPRPSVDVYKDICQNNQISI